MNAGPRFPVIVLDNGALTRASIERVAGYASRVTLLGGERQPDLARVLRASGVDAVLAGRPHAGIADALSAAFDDSGAMVAAGPPLDGPALLADVDGWLGDHGASGCLVHLVAPHPVRTTRVVTWSEPASTWAPDIARGAAALLHGRVDALAPQAPGIAGGLLESPTGDLVLVAAACPPYAALSAQRVDSRGVNAAEVIHAILTDTGLTVTNRTHLGIDVRVRLGRVGDPATDLGRHEASLPPGGRLDLDHRDLDYLGGEEPPSAVLRQWSHESEIVYEGGTRRINGVDVRYRDDAGSTLATASHGSHRGLVVGVTATQIAEDIGAQLPSASRRYAHELAPSTLTLPDALRALHTPLAQRV